MTARSSSPNRTNTLTKGSIRTQVNLVYGNCNRMSLLAGNVCCASLVVQSLLLILSVVLRSLLFHPLVILVCSSPALCHGLTIIINYITSKAYNMLGLVRRSFSNQLPVAVKKSLYLSLVRSHLLYCSVIWRPHLVKDILLLENIQRRATKYILNDFSSDYKSRLLSLNLLPLSMVLQLSDIIFFLKSFRSPSSALILTSWTMSVSVIR